MRKASKTKRISNYFHTQTYTLKGEREDPNGSGIEGLATGLVQSRALDSCALMFALPLSFRFTSFTSAFLSSALYHF